MALLCPDLPRPQFNSIWEYKGNLYQVNSVMEKNLIQYDGEWNPTVRYTCYPQTELVFYRSLREFFEKFNGYTMP